MNFIPLVSSREKEIKAKTEELDEVKEKLLQEKDEKQVLLYRISNVLEKVIK